MATFSRLQKLIDLAKEPSSEKRRDLLREITDIFLEDPEGYSDREQEHFADIMGQVAHDLERQVREELALKLADVPNAPAKLAFQLANDDIEVARPILERSRALSDGDLVSIVRAQGTAHQSVIAQRPEVSADVSDALVERGDSGVLHTLIGNRGATIARHTMERVVARAEKDAGIQAPLLDRQDLPADLMHDMFWFVSSKLRERILNLSAGLDPAVVDRLLAESERAFEARMQSGQKARSKAQEYVDKLARRNELNEHTLVQLLREKRVAELVCGFARLAQIDEATARRILSDQTGEGLAIACKANQFDRSTFSTFVLLASPSGARKIDQTYVLLALYDQVPADVAQRTMRFWRVRREAMESAAAA